MPAGRPIVWLGAFVGSHSATAFDSVVFFKTTPVRRGFLFTMTVGHVAIQLLDVDTGVVSLEPMGVGVAAWNEAMPQIWPVETPVLEWPPRYLHDDAGLSALIDRWKPPTVGAK